MSRLRLPWTLGTVLVVATVLAQAGLSLVTRAHAQDDASEERRAFNPREQIRAIIDPENRVPLEERYTIYQWEKPRLRTALYEERDFKKVEKMIRRFREMPLEDRPATAYTRAISSLAEIADDVDIEQQQAVLDEWCRTSESHLPWLVRGRHYDEDAFRIRGGDWASEVPSEAWPQFYERMESMEADLKKAAEIDASDADVFGAMIAADIALGHPRSVMEEHFAAATALDPGNFYAWSAKLTYLQPRWHGSEASAQEVVEQALALANEHPQLHHVWLTNEWFDATLKMGTRDWFDATEYEAIQSYFESQLEQFPDSVFLNQYFALFAFLAEDWETAFNCMDAVGDVFSHASGWGSLEFYNSARAWTYVHLAKNQPRRTRLEYVIEALRLAPDDRGIALSATDTIRTLLVDAGIQASMAEHLVRIDASYAPGYLLWGAALANMGRYEEALEALDRGQPKAVDRFAPLVQQFERIRSQIQKEMAKPAGE